MIKLFSKRKAKGQEPRRFSVPEDRIVYAIGDVHGCLMSMINLLEKIKLDRAAQDVSQATIVFLGDLVDRGPSSKEVLEFLIKFKPGWADTVFLKGNHEEVMLQVLSGDISAMRSWFSFGGKACARNYGVDNFGQIDMNPDAIMAALQRNVPQKHLNFIAGFKDSWKCGDYLFVHAGIRPKVEIEKQTAHDMRWIRAKFIEYKKHHPLMVVHGHTVTESGPEHHSNRIAVDTGAHKGRPLTAVCLKGEDVKFLQSEALGD